ncbi:unnamed protein product [Aphanomyces euteiches]|nr:hypothetical protein AeRB84_004940 [Aphanomyces euteiches]
MYTATATAAAASLSTGTYSWCADKTSTVQRRQSVSLTKRSIASTASTKANSLNKASQNATTKRAMPPRNALKKQHDAMLKTRSDQSALVKQTEAVMQWATAFMGDVPHLI